MNADLVCWGSSHLKTEVDASSEAKSIFFKDETTGYCRIFMELDQMQTLKAQLETALAASEVAETTTVQA